MAMNLLTFDARVKGIFYAASEEASVLPWIDSIAWQTDSKKAQETYAKLGAAPRMSRWDGGPRVVNSPEETSLVVTNYDYAVAEEISAKDYRRENFGEFDRLIAEMSTGAVTHPNELVLERIRGFESEVCYDKQFYFDTDHVSGKSGVQSNDLTFNAVDPNKPTIAECRDAILQAVLGQMSFLNDQGRPWSVGSQGQFLVLCSTNLIDVMNPALFAGTIVDSGAAVDNTLKFANMGFTLVHDATLNATWGDSTKQFALIRTDGAGSAIIIQDEVPVTPDDAGINHYELFHNKRLLFGVQRAYEIRGLHWHKSVLTTFT